MFSSDVLSLTDSSFVRNIRNTQDLFAMDGGLYGRRYGNSLVHAVLGALISTACGYAFGRYRFAHREKRSGLAPAAVMVLQTLLTLPLCPMASGAGLVNTFRAVLVPLLFSPFGGLSRPDPQSGPSI